MKSMAVLSSNIAKNSVYIQNNKKDRRGTGFILKLYDDQKFAYLFTAKHVVLGENYLENQNDQVWQFNNDDFSFSLGEKDIFLYENKIFFLDVDIAIGLVDLVENNLDDVNKIRLSDYHVANNQKSEFYTFGYPVIASEKYGQVIELDFLREIGTQEHGELIFSSRVVLGNAKISSGSVSSNISTVLGGLSGSGVFVNNDLNYLYLNSLIVKADGLTNIIALNILEQIDNINSLFEKIKDDIPIPPIELNSYFSFDNEVIKLDHIDYEKFKEKIGEISEEALSPYKDSSKVISEKKKIELQRKKLAQYCATLALSFNQEKKYHLATRYFNHAIDLDLSYKPLFLITKSDRVKYNKTLLDVTNNVLLNHNISYEEQYELIKQKVAALDDNADEQYDALMEFFNIRKKLGESENSKSECENYLSLARNIINKNVKSLLEQNKTVTIDNYLYMVEVAKNNKSSYYSAYFLYAARDMLKFLYNKKQSKKEDVEHINKNLSLVLGDESYERAVIFQAQTDAEEDIKLLLDVKESSDIQFFNDVKNILQKLDDIYDKTNDAGLLKEISQRIDVISRKIGTSNTNVNSVESSDEIKPSKKSGFTLKNIGVGLFIEICLLFGLIIFLSGNVVKSVI